MNKLKELVIFEYLAFISIVVMFFSIFLFLRVAISICIVLIIVMCVLSKRPLLKGLKDYPSLCFLLVAGIFINVSMLYLMILNHTFYGKELLSFSNPILIALYIYCLNYFLSQNKKYGKYLVNLLICIVSIMSIAALIIFLYKSFDGKSFILSDLYKGINGGSIIQSIVALIFPLSAVIFTTNAIKLSNIKLKLLLFSLAIIIFFTDLFINKSKAGYIIEFVILIYYSIALIRKNIYKDGILNIKRGLLVTLSSIAFISVLLGVTYKNSKVFNIRTTQMISDINTFLVKSGNNEQKLSKKSTGLRLMYYYSAIKTLKEYPKVFLFGCGYATGILGVEQCTSELIENNLKLRSDDYIVNSGIMPHNEFINYIFKGGILSGICLLLFFISLFYEAKYLERNYKNYLRILIVAYFIGCSVSYLITLQISVALIATLIAIFISQLRCKYQVRQPYF